MNIIIFKTISVELTCGCCAGMAISQLNFDQKSNLKICKKTQS